MNLGIYPLSRKENIVIQAFDNEVLIYDLNINKAFCLNETSALVWQECDGTKSVSDISRILSKKLKTNISEDIVWFAVRQFKNDKLLEESIEFITPLDGLSRREVVKRIGFASMVALPVIASVIAPSAIHAQSTCLAPPTCAAPMNTMDLSPGCFCNGNNDCSSGICPVNTNICALGPVVPLCSAVGNNVNASAPCCPCQSNSDCIEGICPVNTMICSDI